MPSNTPPPDNETLQALWDAARQLLETAQANRQDALRRAAYLSAIGGLPANQPRIEKAWQRYDHWRVGKARAALKKAFTRLSQIQNEQINRICTYYKEILATLSYFWSRL